MTELLVEPPPEETVPLIAADLNSAAESAESGLPQGIAPFALPDFGTAPRDREQQAEPTPAESSLHVQIELGRLLMHLEDLLNLGEGSVVTLDALVDDPVDIVIEGRLIGRGEVLHREETFCVRVIELFDVNFSSI